MPTRHRRPGSRARAARERNERLVTSYTATVTQRMGAGIQALSRDRMLYHQELSANIAWKRDGKSTITVTGARQALPAITRGEKVPDDLDSDVRWLVVNPAEDYLGMLGSDEDGFVYPLREGGEQDYRLRSAIPRSSPSRAGSRSGSSSSRSPPVARSGSSWRARSGSTPTPTVWSAPCSVPPGRTTCAATATRTISKDVPSWVNAGRNQVHHHGVWALRGPLVDAALCARSTRSATRVVAGYSGQVRAGVFRLRGRRRNAPARREHLPAGRHGPRREPEDDARTRGPWRALRDSLGPFADECRDRISERSRIESA